MKISIASPIPVLGSLPGPSRPGWPSEGAFEFKMEIQGPATFSFNASKSGGGTNFSIDWGDTTTASGLTGTSHSHAYGAGTFTLAINSKDDAGPINTFQVTGIQANKNSLKKILNWGETSWVDLNSAFLNCYGLTHVAKSKLYATNVRLDSTFRGCSSLTSADLSELNISNNISIYQMFKDCTALQFLSFKNNNSQFKLGTLGAAQNQSEAFMNIGSGVSTGCEVVIKDTEFVNVRTSSTVLTDMFRNVRFKDTSNLSGLSFSGLAFTFNLMFQYAHVPQDNSFLNISNWSFNHTNEFSPQSLFFRFNDDAASGINTDIDTSNWYFGKCTGLMQWFYYCNIRTIRGLSTWTRDNNVVLTNLLRAFNRWFNAKIPSNDNFSSSFWANSIITNMAETFFYAGSTSTDAETGAFPNLNGLVLNAASFIDAFRLSKWNTRADFTGVTQYTGAGQVAKTDCQRMFQSINIIGSDRKIVLNIDDLRVSIARSMFYISDVESIDISSVVDFSTCTNFQYMFLGGTPYYDGNVTLPTNMDFSSTTTWNGSLATNHFPEISFSTCQINNLIRRIHATLPVRPNNSTNQIYSPNSQLSASPANVQKLESSLVSPGGYNIVVDSTDAALPFSYPAYAFDPATTSSVTPDLVPSGAIFSSDTSGITINSSTGEVSWPSNFTGAITVKCTYDDGCFNEVDLSVSNPTKVSVFVTPGVEETVAIGYIRGEGFTVDWGDGNVEFFDQYYPAWSTITHVYNPGGVGTTSNPVIKVGMSKYSSIQEPTRWGFGSSGSKAKEILQWGDVEYSNMDYMFSGCQQVVMSASDTPDLTNCGSFYRMWYLCYALTGQQLGANWSWTFSKANTSTRDMFMRAFSFNGNVSGMNVSNVSNFYNMFGAYANGNYNFNQDLSSWDLSSATSLSFMFNYCRAFNQPIATNGNTGSVTSVYNMFNSTGNVWNQDISNWDITGLTGTNSPWLTGGFSQANYDLALDITNGWGSQAANVNTTRVGIYQYYSDGMVFSSFTTSTSASNVLIDNTVNFETSANVGDIIYSTADDVTAAITSIDSPNQVTLDTSNIFGSLDQGYRLQNSNQAKGRHALTSNGWTIEDRGPISGSVIANNYEMAFNGSSSYINAGNFSLSESAFTIALWQKFQYTPQGVNTIAAKSSIGAGQFEILGNTNGSFDINLYGSNGTINITTSTGSGGYNNSNWNLLVLTWSTTEGAKWYFNGTERGTDTTNIGTLLQGGGDFLIGARNSASPQDFYGNSTTGSGFRAMDEFAVWNEVLTPNEIQTMKNAKSNGFTADLNNLGGVAEPKLWNRMGD